MTKAYQEGKDLYATMGVGAFHNTYWDNMEHNPDGSANVDGKARRSKCKKLLLGITYGMGPALTAENMKVSVKEAKEIINTFYESFPKVKDFVENNEDLAERDGFVEDVWGRKRRLPDAQLPEYEISQSKFKTDFNPLLSTDGTVYEYDTKSIDNYKKALSNCKSLKEKETIKEQAKKNGIIIKDNGGFISKAKRQSTNARIQGCLSYDTKIITKEFGIVNIGDVAGKHLYVWDGDEWSSADIVASGIKQKCIISLTTGQIIECSPNHLFKVGEKFIKCEELNIGDNIDSIDNFITDINLSYHNYSEVESIDITNDYIEMYDVCDTERGYFVADGLIVHNSAASMTKKAMINIYNDKELNDLGFRLLIGVHDELIGECPEENSEQVGERLSYLMSHAAEDIVTTVPFKVDPEIESHWYFNTYSHTVQKEYNDYLKNGLSNEESFKKLCDDHSECTEIQLKNCLNNKN